MWRLDAFGEFPAVAQVHVLQTNHTGVRLRASCRGQCRAYGPVRVGRRSRLSSVVEAVSDSDHYLARLCSSEQVKSIGAKCNGRHMMIVPESPPLQSASS